MHNAFFQPRWWSLTLSDHDPASAGDSFPPVHRTPEFPSRGLSVKDSDNKLTLPNEDLDKILDYLGSKDITNPGARLETTQTVAAPPVQNLCSARFSLALGAEVAGGQEWDYNESIVYSQENHCSPYT